MILAAIFKKPTSQDVEKLVEVLELVWQKIIHTIKDPLANPRETVVIIGILVVIFLIIITLLLLTATIKQSIEQQPPKKRKPKKKLTPEQHKKLYLIIGVIFIIILVASLTVSSNAQFCNQCHLLNQAYQTWKESTHKKINCLDCHDEPGFLGFVLGKARGLNNLAAYISKNYQLPLSTTVKNSSCLRCHQPRMTKTLEVRGIRVSHKEINQAGFFCTECHTALVHQNKNKQRPAIMDKCITCHNEQKASSRCSLCHPIDIAYRPDRSLEDFPKVHLDEPNSCRGCHSPAQERKCLNCHGLEMPHTAKFVQGGHARLGFINKSVCYRCHEPFSCAGCHTGVSGHTGAWRIHGPTWIKEHRTKTASNCQGGPCHKPHICELCHREKIER